MDVVFKVRENKARRAAARQGLVLEKSRVRDPLALGYRRYRVLYPDGRVLYGGNPHPYSATLEDIESRLKMGGLSAWVEQG